MSYDINNVVIVGRLTRGVESSYTQNNNPICKFSIANNNGKNDDPKSVSYFDIITWNKTAEICSKFLNKGNQVVITGRLQQDRFTNREGQNTSRITIVANNVQFIGSAPGDKNGQQPPQNQQQPYQTQSNNNFSQNSQQPQQQNQQYQHQPPEQNIDIDLSNNNGGDDIPF